MSAHWTLQEVFLGIVVLSCWVGVIGMWRMREPMQALHYLSVPATVGAFSLVVAVWLIGRANEAFWKTLVIAFVLLATNSVVTHATGRSFRARELGHWEPQNGDPIEFVRDTEAK